MQPTHLSNPTSLKCPIDEKHNISILTWENVQNLLRDADPQLYNIYKGKRKDEYCSSIVWCEDCRHYRCPQDKTWKDTALQKVLKRQDKIAQINKTEAEKKREREAKREAKEKGC